ncbi:MAG TPA: 4-oxalocrotonate tautomerase family protein [Burkholderiaceae bacterium]|nr:4-oxalocrotonate tautomerase family protein [Burkholderiaceae bacterium]
MPTLTLQLNHQPSAERAAEIARRLTALTATLLGKRPEVTAVVIQAMPREHWFIGGEAAALPAARLGIRISSGTHTDGEKAAFIAQAWRALAQWHAPLGELAPASYVEISERPLEDWGYAGRTQAARRCAHGEAATPA